MKDSLLLEDELVLMFLLLSHIVLFLMYLATA